MQSTKINFATLRARLCDLTALVLPGAFLLVIGKARLLSRSESWSPNIENIIFASGNDLLTLITVVAVVAFLPIKAWMKFLVAFLIYFVLWIGIFFQIKMGLPLSAGLLTQIDNIFDLQTSIAAAGTLRTYLWVVLSICIYFIGYFVLRWVQIKFVLVSSITPVLFFISLLTIAMAPKSMRDLRTNLFLSSLHIVKSEEKLEQVFSELEKNLKTVEDNSNFQFVAAEPTISEKANVVLIILESFNYEIVADRKQFEKVMPFLHSQLNSLLSFTHHYTPWPFSSKALYSIICANYPQLSPFIEIRVNPNAECASWSRSLAEAGYHTWAGYSGDFRYDQMGRFLQFNGIKEIVDKNDFLKKKAYAKNSWGVDDQALVDEFISSIENKSGPFLRLLIPINSHHPGWTPRKEFERFDESVLNAFYYQDHLIRQIFNALKNADVYDQTMILITGDHGRKFRERKIPAGILDRVDYHVPMFVKLDQQGSQATERLGQVVSYPSSHVEIGGFLLNHLGIKGKYLKKHVLAGKVPVFAYKAFSGLRLMSLGDRAVLFDAETKALYQGKEWVDDHAVTCPMGGCKNEIKHMIQLHQFLKGFRGEFE